MAGKVNHIDDARMLNVQFKDHFELSSPPFDSVAQVRFSPTNPDHLLVTSWDTVCVK